MPYLQDECLAGTGYKARGSRATGKAGPLSVHVILGPISRHMISPAGKQEEDEALKRRKQKLPVPLKTRPRTDTESCAE